MDGRQLIRDLVTAVAPSASVMGIDEEQDAYRVRMTGTSNVVAECTLGRHFVDSANDRADAREQVTAALRRCADRVVAPIPDGRA